VPQVDGGNADPIQLIEEGDPVHPCQLSSFAGGQTPELEELGRTQEPQLPGEFLIGMWMRTPILSPMRTVQLTLDDALVDAVDRAARSLGATRVAFIREAIQAALTRLHERELELRHRAGYERKPVEPGEFSDWESEQEYLTERAARGSREKFEKALTKIPDREPEEQDRL
jgi:predicted transcriptional regulator